MRVELLEDILNGIEYKIMEEVDCHPIYKYVLVAFYPFSGWLNKGTFGSIEEAKEEMEKIANKYN